MSVLDRQNLSTVTMSQVNALVLLFTGSVAPRTSPSSFRPYGPFIELDESFTFIIPPSKNAMPLPIRQTNYNKYMHMNICICEIYVHMCFMYIFPYKVKGI